MCADIPPETVQTHPPARRPRPSRLEDSLGDPESRVGGNDFDAGNPLCCFPALSRAKVPPAEGVSGVDIGEHGAGAVGQRFRGTEVSEEGAVAREDVKLVDARGDGFGSIRPWAGVLCGVGCCKGERTQSDAEIEVGEDELNSVGETILLERFSFSKGKGKRSRG